MSFSVLDIFTFLLLAARWTLALSAIAFAGGGIGALLLLILRYAYPRTGSKLTVVYSNIFQGTPLLLQLFTVYFGLPLLGIDVSAWAAAGLALSLFASAYLADIWRGCIDVIPTGQWDAGRSFGMSLPLLMRRIILPLAIPAATPPTVGFLVQLVKSTALTSIIGFDELLRASQIVTNATFQPLKVYGLAAIIYFAICFPLTLGSRYLERRMARAQRTPARP